MILDTTYLLPLIGVGIETDFFKALVENRVKQGIRLYNIKINLVSIFELQAKASKLDIPPDHVVKALNIMSRSLKIIPFYKGEIIEEAHRLNKILGDYIDSVIVATAIALKEDLLTEGSIIHRNKKLIEGKYEVNILRYKDVAIE